MKKYFYEADKRLKEKAYQSYARVHTMPAVIIVYAESEKDAEKLAREKLRAIYQGSGVLLENFRLARCADVPVDWSYGYGDERRSGDTDGIPDTVGNSQIR